MKNFKKAASILLSMLLVVSLMPLSVFAEGLATEELTATGSDIQIGEYYQVDDNTGALLERVDFEGNTQQSYADGQVKVNKTITGTDTENVFDINLEVITQDKIEQTAVSPDAAVVLVIDTSGSMGQKGRLSAAKNAAKSFIKSFADENAVRKVAVVEFSGLEKGDDGENKYNKKNGAKVVKDWTDVQEGTECSAEIENLSAYGGTNMEAGLQLAKNLLGMDSVKNISNKSIVMLTDGNPTYGIGKYGNRTSTDIICSDGKDMIGDGTKTTHNIHRQVEEISKSIRNAKINTYAVQVGTEEIECNGWVHCSLEQPVATWLNKNCGFVTKQVDNVDEISDIFNQIVEMIELQAKAWILTDPMGTNIDFVKFNRKAGFEGEFEFKNDNKTITWNLKNCTPVFDQTKKTYTYHLSYQVKLDTLSDGYQKGTYYATNGVTSLTYFILEEDQEIDENLLKTAYFNIPSVKGFAGDLSFTKKDDSGKSLSGAVFALKADDRVVKTATSGADGKVSFTDIPSGHSYTLEETDVPNGYINKDEFGKNVVVSFGDVTAAVRDSEVINHYNKTSVTVEKVWNDNDNKAGKRPECITVQLLADGKTCGERVVIYGPKVQDIDSGTDESSGELSNEATVENQNGKDAENQGEDADVQPDVSDENQESAGEDVEQLNTPSDETSSAGESNMDESSDNEQPEEDSAAFRTASASPNTTADITEPEPVGNWTYTWTDLPKYNADGSKIVYTVEEVNVPEDYTPSVTGSADAGFTITNTYEATTRDWTVNKVWDDGNNQDGKRPEEITVQLYAGEDAYGEPVILNAANEWSYIWKELSVKNDNGDKITYSVQEVKVPEGYASSVTNSEGTSIITNSHAPETISVSVNKIWDDNNNAANKRPNGITAELLKDNTPTGNDKTLSAANNWSGRWDNLPKYENGKEITYTIREKDVPAGYTSVVTGTVAEGFTITNTIIPEKTVTITVKKVWNDAGYENNRPATITVNIKNGEEIADTVTLGNGVWSKVIELPEKDENGKDIVYAIEEASVPAGYTSTVNGYTITNTYTPDRPIIIPDPDVPLDPGPGPDEPDEPDEPIIDDPDVPLGPGPGDDTEIDEPDVPLAPGPVDTEETKADPDEPKTGDESPLMALTAMLVVSTGTLSTIIVRKKRKNEK